MPSGVVPGPGSGVGCPVVAVAEGAAVAVLVVVGGVVGLDVGDVVAAVVGVAEVVPVAAATLGVGTNVAVGTERVVVGCVVSVATAVVLGVTTAPMSVPALPQAVSSALRSNRMVEPIGFMVILVCRRESSA